MSFEHPAFSFDQRQPPTPTRTPTSPSFTDVFKTPKFESSFYDPRVNWNTADPGTTSPSILKTPKPLSFGSNNGSQPNDLDFLANAQQLLATPDFSALPIGSSFEAVSRDGITQIISQESLSLNTSFEPSSNIQTPPPTTTSATKRQGKKAQISQNGKAPVSPSRRKSVPILPKPAGSGNAGAVVETSPGELGLDFSPAEFGWAASTAPAYPQQKLFWEPDANDTMNMDMPNMSFNTSRAGLEAFVSTHPSVSNSQRTITDDFGFDNDTTPMASFNHNMEDFGGQPLGQTLQGVDPSLLFSSPGHSNTVRNSTSMADDAMQPYAYQLQEARREKAYNGVVKPKRRRKPSVDSPAVIAAMEKLREEAPRPALHRSMTDTAMPRLMHDLPRASTAHGRSSPLKAVRESKKKQSRSHRTSIALTIDEHGRARAEARSGPLEEEAMDIDTGSESSCTASSVDDYTEDMTASFSRQPGPRMGRFGRSNHSQKSSNASSFYSSSSHQDTGNRMTTMGGPSLRTVIREDESEAETVLNSEDGEDHAQDQLRRSLHDRQSRTTAHHLYSPQIASTAFFGNSDMKDLSPTTIPDPELPSPFSTNNPVDLDIRCVCGTTIDDRQLIQCNSCKKWSHMPCAGVDPNRFPNVYLCLFCTGSTPIARGNRVRDPTRKPHRSNGSGPSPLAQKSSRYR